MRIIPSENDGLRLVFFELPGLDQFRFFGADAVKENARRFIVRVLRHELPLDRPLEDGFFQLFREFCIKFLNTGLRLIVFFQMRQKCFNFRHDALLFGKGYAGKLRNSMNTAIKRTEATEYIDQSSFYLTRSQDMFMYSNTTRTAIPTETRSGGGGGSSIHTSSGGHSHSGGGGHF